MEKYSILGVVGLWVIVLFILDNYVVESIVVHIANKRLRMFVVALIVIGVILGVCASLQIITSETQYVIVDAQTTEAGKLRMTVKDEDGNSATTLVEIDDVITEQRGNDSLIVQNYITGKKRFTIKCSEQSEFLQAYNSFQLQQQLLN